MKKHSSALRKEQIYELDKDKRQASEERWTVPCSV